MADNKHGLGRGLDSLIPTEITAATQANTGRLSGEAIGQVEVALIDPNPGQPRQEFDATELSGLAASIKAHGILQPLIVSQAGARYQLVAGERRLRAAKLAGLTKVPVVIRSADDQQRLELALIENLQREDLSPLETAKAYRLLIDQFNLQVQEVARRMGKSQPVISGTLRLLNLQPEAQVALSEGRINEGHSRAILSLTEPEKQRELLQMIMAKGWSPKQAEEFARGWKGPTGSKMKAQARIATTNALTERLSKYLRATVTQRPTPKGGRIIIEYTGGEAELERITKAIQGQ